MSAPPPMDHSRLSTEFSLHLAPVSADGNWDTEVMAELNGAPVAADELTVRPAETLRREYEETPWEPMYDITPPRASHY